MLNVLYCHLRIPLITTIQYNNRPNTHQLLFGSTNKKYLFGGFVCLFWFLFFSICLSPPRKIILIFSSIIHRSSFFWAWIPYFGVYIFFLCGKVRSVCIYFLITMKPPLTLQASWEHPGTLCSFV